MAATAVKTWGAAPFPVVGAAVIALCKASFLIIMGIIGVAAANSISNPFGEGILVFGVIYAAIAYLVPRGSRLARAALTLISLVPAVFGIVYAFTGPSPTVIPSLVTAALALAVLAALWWPENARAYFER